LLGSLALAIKSKVRKGEARGREGTEKGIRRRKREGRRGVSFLKHKT
jgi:hypothetical protein